MAGFPTRPDRSAFGPTPVNRFPVRDNERELGADIGDLMMWQLSGCGLMVPVATAFIVVNALDVATLGASAEAWDPKSLYVPSLVQNGVGDYTLTYAAAYPDKDGTSITTALSGALPHVQCHETWIAIGEVQANKREVRIFVYDFVTGLADDPTSRNIFVPIW